MGLEKYKPTPEEIKNAEKNLTPEQKLQSEAREEGYNIGASKGQQTVYVGDVLSTEKKKVPETIKFEFTLTIGNRIWKHVLNFIQKETNNNGIKMTYSAVPGSSNSIFKFYLEGAPVSIKRVATNIDSMLAAHKKNNPSIEDIFKDIFK